MPNLRTDEIVFFCNLTKIGTDENKAIYSSWDFLHWFFYTSVLCYEVRFFISS